MKADCQWFGSKLEAYFCDTLSAAELHLASEHLKTCSSCHDEVAALKAIDPLVKGVMNLRMEKALSAASAPRRGFALRFGLVTAAASLAAVLMVAVFMRQVKGPEPLQPAPSTQVVAVQESKSDKIAGPEDVNRLKMGDKLDTTPASPKPAADVVNSDSPEFQVIDAAGYSTTLQDYRGRILLFGVWSGDKPEAAENLQQLYQAFGTRRDIRILGVSNRNQDRMPKTTFPMVFNNGSKLLETPNSEFAIVDKDGSVQLRGSLLGDSKALVSKIKTKLDQLSK